ncbi:MAG TPA: hypothetical protein VLV56_07745 [Burkholderiales bacterium]|nr:hypothetical protein [Burkholderiales bacterium]
MIENPVDFALNVIAGAVALFCLFEGTRRLGAHGVHRKAVLLMVLSASACALYGMFAYQRYVDLNGTLSAAQRKSGPAVAASWSRVASPEKRELLSQALARQNFRASGTLGPYVDRNGTTRTFAPTQEDLLARERVVAYFSRTEFSVRSSLAEALLWLIAGIVAVVLGFAMSLDKPPARHSQDEALQGDLK